MAPGVHDIRAAHVEQQHRQAALLTVTVGTPILKGPCTYSSGFDAYQCRQEDDAFGHDPRNLPVPKPPGSYFSDPQVHAPHCSSYFVPPANQASAWIASNRDTAMSDSTAVCMPLPDHDLTPNLQLSCALRCAHAAFHTQLFVLESRDADTESRNFGPVHFGLANGSSVDLVVVARDQGWCFAYTCQERLSSFWTYLPSK
eukprot:1159614-Pelagomonas_calceolata.AAC.7